MQIEKSCPEQLFGVQRSESILDLDRVIVPVHLGNHWTCALLDLAAKEVVYYDSLGVSLPTGI